MQTKLRRTIIGAVVSILLPVIHGLAASPPNGIAPLLVPAGGFAIEGGLLANTPATGVGDWIAMTNLFPGAGRGVLASNGTPLNAITTFRFVDPYTTNTDTIMTGGDASGNPNVWTWGTGTVANKEDMNNGLVHIGRDNSNHVWVVVSADHTGTGDADMFFYFLQNTLTKNTNGTFTSAGPHAGLTMRDLRLKLNFSGSSFLADQWQTNTSGGGYKWADVTASLPVGHVFMAVNPANTYVPYGTFGSTNCPTGDFVEAAADFSALVGSTDPCATIGFKNVLMVTLHSSGTMSDFINPIPAIITIGLTADAGADQIKCFAGATTSFSLSGNMSVGGAAATSTNWTVVSGDAIIANPGSLNTTVQVLSTTAGTNVTLRLTVTSTCTNKSDDVVLTVTPAPTPCSVSGATLVCPASTNQYSGPAGMSSYAWRLTGNGRITGPTNQLTVTVVAGTNCGPHFTLSLTTTTNICTLSCSTDVAVVDTAPPSLDIPSDLVLDCPAVTTTNATGVATASDGCSRATVTWSDSVTNLCGPTKIIARTWTATDNCGNSTNRVQTISVRDITAPVITCPASLTLDCPAVTTTNATGVATATDTCSAVTISYADATTPNCGGTRAITRTWTATDECGNFTNCVQTITVRDTNAPSITCPASVTVECGAPTTTNATGVATATDTCSSATVSFADSTTNLCGGTKIITRTWTARDSCNNSVSCAQIITVLDRTAPKLTLPTNRTLTCPGVTTTNATGVATATDVCGGVTVTYSDVTSNSCGLTRTVWRTWTATDQCGNSTNGLQTIVVVDTNKPTFVCPSVSVQCADDVPPAYTNLAAFRAAGGTASDACSTALAFSMTSNGVLVGSCPGTVTRVYHVIDDCGNFADCTQTIIVRDTIAPVVTCPAGVTLECGTPLPATNSDAVTATDNCSTNVVITYTDAPETSSYSVDFYAADPDSGSGSYSPTYLKLSPPNMPCPSGGRAQDPLRNAVCFGPGGSIDAVSTMDNTTLYFGQVMPFEAIVTMNGAPGPEKGRVEFTCDWSTYTTSSRRFGYNTNYMVYCAFVDPGDLGTIDPHTNARVESVTSTLVNRGTGDEKIRGTIRVAGLDPGDRVVVEIWVVLDGTESDNPNGNISAGLVSGFKVLNPPVPIATSGTSISINANKVDPLPVPQAQPPLPPLPPQPAWTPRNIVNIIDRTWRGTDDCGNQGVCVQKFTLRDSKPPLLAPPPNMTLDCPANSTGTNVAGVAAAPDACGSAVKLVYSDIISNGCGVTKTVARTWTATDEYDNTTNKVQTIIVRDIIPPALTVPTNVTLECSGDTRTNATGAATATDACGGVALSYRDLVAGSNVCDQVITRTWTATDTCGNTTNGVQTIRVNDTILPTLSALTNKTITNGMALVFDVPNAFDACGVDYIAIVSTVTNIPGPGTYAVTRTWHAADFCGNLSTNGSQTITVFSPLARVRLAATRLASNSVVLYWPTNYTGYSLERSSNLMNWSPFAASLVQTNAELRVYLSPTNPYLFYRLMHP